MERDYIPITMDHPSATNDLLFELHPVSGAQEALDNDGYNLSFGILMAVDLDMDPDLGQSNITHPIDNVTASYIPEEISLSDSSNVVLIILYSLTTLLTVFGNVVVIIVFALGKRSRSDLRGFLINLAVADLVMAIFCMPFTFTSTMLKNWIFSKPMCPIVLYLQTVSVTASVCTNMAVGIDRFWVVNFPLKSRITKSRSKWVIAVIWFIACGLSTVQLAVGRSTPSVIAPGYVVWECNEVWPEPSNTWRRSYTFFILSSTYIIPLLILAFTYGFVGWKLWQRTTPGNADEVRDTHQLRSKRKVIKMLVVIVCLFGICWLPLHVFMLVLDFQPQLMAIPGAEHIFVVVYYCVHWLAMSNSFVNPIIYGFLNDSFRGDLKRMVRLWCPCCKEFPCLNQELLARESTYRAYSHKSALRDSTSGSIVTSNGSRRKLLSVKLNGCGKCKTELSVKDGLLHQGLQGRKTPV